MEVVGRWQGGGDEERERGSKGSEKTRRRDKTDGVRVYLVTQTESRGYGDYDLQSAVCILRLPRVIPCRKQRQRSPFFLRLLARVVPLLSHIRLIHVLTRAANHPSPSPSGRVSTLLDCSHRCCHRWHVICSPVSSALLKHSSPIPHPTSHGVPKLLRRPMVHDSMIPWFYGSIPTSWEKNRPLFFILLSCSLFVSPPLLSPPHPAN